MPERADPAALPVAPLSPLPEVEPHFEGLRAKRLILPRCDACALLIWYPRAFCPVCSCGNVTWIEVSGRGEVHSYTTVHKGLASFAGHVPYTVAYVDLDEGPRILTNIVGGAPADVSIGARVEAVFDITENEVPILRFRLVPASAAD